MKPSTFPKPSWTHVIQKMTPKYHIGHFGVSQGVAKPQNHCFFSRRPPPETFLESFAFCSNLCHRGTIVFVTRSTFRELFVAPVLRLPAYRRRNNFQGDTGSRARAQGPIFRPIFGPSYRPTFGPLLRPTFGPGPMGGPIFTPQWPGS